MGVCDPALNAFAALDCEVKVGGVEAVLIIDCALGTIDPVDSAAILVQIGLGTIILIEPIRGEEPEPEDIELANNDGGGELTTINKHRRFISWVDGAVTDANITAYNLLNGADKQVILRYKEDGEQRYISQAVKFNVKDITPNDKFTNRMFQVIGTYTSKDMFGITPEVTGVYTQ